MTQGNIQPSLISSGICQSSKNKDSGFTDSNGNLQLSCYMVIISMWLRFFLFFSRLQITKAGLKLQGEFLFLFFGLFFYDNTANLLFLPADLK